MICPNSNPRGLAAPASEPRLTDAQARACSSAPSEAIAFRPQAGFLSQRSRRKWDRTTGGPLRGQHGEAVRVQGGHSRRPQHVCQRPSARPSARPVIRDTHLACLLLLKATLGQKKEKSSNLILFFEYFFFLIIKEMSFRYRKFRYHHSYSIINIPSNSTPKVASTRFMHRLLSFPYIFMC